MQKLASLLKVRPEEGGLVLLVGILFMSIQAGQGMGDNAASALFFLRFGVDFLPYMYLILGGATFVVTLAYSVGLGRFERSRFFQSLIIGLIVVLLIERLALTKPFSLLYPILWLTISCMGMIFGTLSWNLAGAVCDARQAKRLFPLFASAGILGSVLGNSITGLIAKRLGTDNLLILYAALLGVVFILTRRIARKYFRPVKSTERQSSFWDDLRAGFDFVRGSALMKLIAYASILFSILYFAIAFPFNKVAAASFPDEAGVAGFLGLFNGVTTAVTFIVSLLLANRVYARLGVVNSVLLLPLIYLFGFIIFAARYSLNSAVIARFSQWVLLAGVADSAWNALFNVVPAQRRGQVQAFNNGVPSQIGVALSGVLLIAGEKLSTQQIFWMGMAVALACAFIVWRMRAAYGEALIEALRAGRLEVFSSDATAFAGLQSDAAALNVVTRALQDSKPTTRRLAAEILGRMKNATAIAPLTRQLADPEAGVRAAILRALGKLRADSAFDLILNSLDDSDAEVRKQALTSLSQLEAQASPTLLSKLSKLLDDPSVPVRTCAAMCLAKLGQGEQASMSLMKWLEDGDMSLRVAALEAIGQSADYLNEKFDSAPVLRSLQDEAVLIREAACRALAGFKGEASARALVARLSDSSAPVRSAAADSLCRRGGETAPFVLEVLVSNDAAACDAALEALAPVDARTFERLRLFAGVEIARLRMLRSQIISLPKEGRALALLRETLQKRARACEKHLLKVIGLMSNPRAMELVRKSMEGGDAEARAAALEALETLGDKTLARGIVSLLEEEPEHSTISDVIENILKSNDRWMRALTIRAIQELGLKEFNSRLAGLRSDPEALVRESALETLIQFGEVSSMETLQTVPLLERVLLLREVPIFADLSPEDLEQIARIAREQWFPNDTALFHEGEEAGMMFIIVGGQVRVLHDVDGKVHAVAQRGPGDFVGEMAIIESAPRAATLIAQGDVRLLAIEGEMFKGILRERPEVSLAVLKSLSRRLREMVAAMSLSN